MKRVNMKTLTNVRAFWLLAIVSVLSCCKAAAPPVRLPEPPATSATSAMEIVAPPVEPVIGDAVRFAMAALQELNDPVLNRRDGMAFQILPDAKYAATVLFAKESDKGRRSLPEVCEARTAKRMQGMTICDFEGKCSLVPPESSPVILCNLDTFRKIALLLTAIHDPAILSNYMKNDWAYMGFATRIDEDSASVDKEVKVDVSDDHMTQHMLYVMTFILAHELHHLQDGSAESDFTSEATAPGFTPQSHKDQISVERVCRNYVEFENHGIRLSGKLGALELGGAARVPLSPEEQTRTAASRKIWRTELDADAYAARKVQDLIRLMIDKEVQAPEDAIVEYSFQSLSTLTLYTWYRRLAKFASVYCEEQSTQSFPISRCMCKSRDNYTRIASLYDDTHPPFYLRMAMATKTILQGLPLSGLNEFARLRLDARAQMMSNLMDTPAKLALGACMLMNMKMFEGTKAVYMSYPAIEGFFGEINRDFAGDPPEKVGLEIMSQCITGAAGGGTNPR